MGNPISTGESAITIGQAATWGTAVNTTNVFHGLVTLSTSKGEFSSRDVGFSNKISEIVKLSESVEVTIAADASYSGDFMYAVGGFMGTCATPVEQTTAQGDYLHDIDLADNATDFYTIAYKAGEDDMVVEIPSVKFHTLAYSHNTNDVGVWTITGTGDRVIHQADTPQNTIAEINALVYPTYQAAVLGGTNHYFRIDTVANAPLSSGNDTEILGLQFQISRPFEPEFTLRAANTPYTAQPQQLGVTKGTLTVNLARSERGTQDWLNHWTDETKLMAELFYDGALIGSTVNASYKFQFPKLELVGGMPSGYDLPNNNQRMRPTIQMNMLQASAAPSGMTGVTEYMRIAAITETVGKYAT